MSVNTVAGSGLEDFGLRDVEDFTSGPKIRPISSNDGRRQSPPEIHHARQTQPADNVDGHRVEASPPIKQATGNVEELDSPPTSDTQPQSAQAAEAKPKRSREYHDNGVPREPERASDYYDPKDTVMRRIRFIGLTLEGAVFVIAAIGALVFLASLFITVVDDDEVGIVLNDDQSAKVLFSGLHVVSPNRSSQVVFKRGEAEIYADTLRPMTADRYPVSELAYSIYYAVQDKALTVVADQYLSRSERAEGGAYVPLSRTVGQQAEVLLSAYIGALGSEELRSAVVPLERQLTQDLNQHIASLLPENMRDAFTLRALIHTLEPAEEIQQIVDQAARERALSRIKNQVQAAQ